MALGSGKALGSDVVVIVVVLVVVVVAISLLLSSFTTPISLSSPLLSEDGHNFVQNFFY